MKKLSDETEEKLILYFSLKSCSKGFYYYISVNGDQNFETEKILCKKNGEKIIFKERMKFSFYFEKNQNVTITTHKKSENGDEFYIDFERKTKITSLVQSYMGKYERKISNKEDNSEVISIQIDKDKSQEEKILFDYLKLGLKFSFNFAFDFRKKDKNKKNDFINYSIEILRKLFDVFSPYFNDENFFHPKLIGGSINDSNNYNIDKKSFSDNEGLIKQYKNFLEDKNIISQDNLILSPLLKNLINNIYTSYKSNVYYILFIFISGDIDEKDQKETINKIIQSSYLPLNIIVIGIGDHDFSAMNELFLDSGKSTEGMPKNKENVIFFSIKNKITIDLNLNGCLTELKKQIIDFFNLVKEPQEKELNIRKSFNIFMSVLNENNRNIIEENKIKNVIKQDVKINDSTEGNIINNNITNIIESIKQSLPPAPPSNVTSYNSNNYNNSNNVEIKGENKKENEKNENKYTPNGSNPLNSTNASYSIFNNQIDSSEY